MMRFLIPIKRDIRSVPPLLSLIKGLGRAGHQVCFFCHNYDPAAFAGSEGPWLQVEAFSDEPYPKGLLQRLAATVMVYWALWHHLANNATAYDYVWLGTWDFRFFGWIAKSVRLRARVVRQYHEYEPERMRRTHAPDVVVVPEENRAWLTYFAAGLSTRPLVLPNTPIDHPRRWTGVSEPAIARLKAAGRVVLIYQGNIDLRKRCLLELLQALAMLPAQFVLALMPLRNSERTEIQRLQSQIARLDLNDRVSWIQSRDAPYHLDVLAQADVGIGLYRPTSLNQVYCAPNRLYELTGYGIPVVLPNFPGLRSLAEKYPGIVTCDPEDIASIANAIQPLAEPARYRRAADGASLFFEERGCYMDHLRSVLQAMSRGHHGVDDTHSFAVTPGNTVDMSLTSR